MPGNRHQERPCDPISADLVRAATSTPRLQVASAPTTSPVVPTSPTEETTITKRFVLTRAEDAELNAFLFRLQQAAGTKVPVNVLVRAAVSILMDAKARLANQLRDARLRQPSAHDRLALGEFEEFWRRALVRALG